MADMTFPLLDWRRRVSELCSDVRRDGTADPRGSLQRFRSQGRALRRASGFAHPGDRSSGVATPLLWPFDPAARFVIPTTRWNLSRRLRPASAGTRSPCAVSVAPGCPSVLSRSTRSTSTAVGSSCVPRCYDGQQTYAAGRYCSTRSRVPTSVATARLVLDFNYAYHPSCTYNPRVELPARAARQLAGAADPGGRTPRLERLVSLPGGPPAFHGDDHAAFARHLGSTDEPTRTATSAQVRLHERRSICRVAPSRRAIFDPFGHISKTPPGFVGDVPDLTRPRAKSARR